MIIKIYLETFITVNENVVGTMQGAAVPGKAEINREQVAWAVSIVSCMLFKKPTAFDSTKLTAFHSILASSLKRSVKQWQRKREEHHQLDICIIRGKQACTI